MGCYPFASLLRLYFDRRYVTAYFMSNCFSYCTSFASARSYTDQVLPSAPW